MNQEETDKQKIEEFYGHCQNDVYKNADYCILVICAGKVIRVYKDPEALRERAFDDLKDIDPMHKIDFLTWEFD